MANSYKINRNNFEKYYKDFEEGRLDENLSEELFYFMEKNNIWQEDDISDIVICPSNDDLLNVVEKQNLLQINPENEGITEANIYFFLNSKIEGLLSEEADKKLTDFLNEQPKYRNELILLEKVKMKSDDNIYYPNKAKLKQKQSKLLWPIIAAAACFAGVLMFTFNIDNEYFKASALENFVKQQNDSLNLNQTENKNNETAPRFNLTQTFQKDYIPNKLLSRPLDSINYTPINWSKVDTFKIYENEIPESNPLIEQIPKELFISSNADLPDLPINKSQQVSMNNPIHPITTGLSYLTQQEIDFRMANNTSDEKGRFFLKIGKLEILHVKN